MTCGKVVLKVVVMVVIVVLGGVPYRGVSLELEIKAGAVHREGRRW